jgi:hypothetical protein
LYGQECTTSPTSNLKYKDSFLHVYMNYVVEDKGMQKDYPFSLYYPNCYNA